MASKFYYEHYEACDDWFVSKRVPSWARKVLVEIFTIRTSMIRRRDMEIKYLREFLKKYKHHLPLKAKQELALHNQSLKFVDKLIKSIDNA